tara:strand:+ start:72 stop:680 length:609 start_codon:yes stop_codon:yes gene_type:complete
MIIGFIFTIFLTLYFAVVVFQGKLASKAWTKNIDDNDTETIEAAVQQAFESWRRPKKNDNIPVADWASIETMEVKSVTKEKCRVSMISGPDIRVINSQRQQIGDTVIVASRASIMLAERLFFEVPFLNFNNIQIDVYELPNNDLSSNNCIFTTQITRKQANETDWDSYMDAQSTKHTLASWDTKALNDSSKSIDPEINAILK